MSVNREKLLEMFVLD